VIDMPKQCLFLDIDKTRIIGGFIPESGIPQVELVKIDPMKDSYQEDMQAEIVKLLLNLKQKHKTKSVLVSLGAPDISFIYIKEVNVFKKKSRISEQVINDLRLNSIRRGTGENKTFICNIVKGIDIDGVKYPGLPKDKKLYGTNVVLENFLAICDNEQINFIKSCIKRAKCKPSGFIAREILVSSQSINSRQKHNGAIFIDIGSQNTTVVFFYQGIIQKLLVYPYGSKDITSLVMKEFGMPFSAAEYIQNKYVDADILKKLSSTESICFTQNHKKYSVDMGRLCQIVSEGIRNICMSIKNDIFTWNYSLDNAKIFITGGITSLDGFLETAEYIFNMPVELAYCKNQSCIQLPGTLMSYAIVPGALWHSISRGEVQNQSFKEKLWMTWKDFWSIF